MQSAPPPILIGIGANLPSAEHGSPRQTCEAAVAAIEEAGLTVTGRSRWYRSAPVPLSDQPWFVNGVVAVATDLPAEDLLSLMHDVERRFGRTRGVRNAPRTLDLDLIAYGDHICGWEEGAEPGGFSLPHPRLHERAFVLFPLRDVAPRWRHPVLHLSLEEMIAGLDPEQVTEPDGPES